ncbi:MAG: PspA/IM30 family protein [Desulfobacteraceae bacterium]|nr:PspA/IM30 family protein [Desulfobacteraceae bacterium]
MGIFTRFRDIVSSNINAMLDKAENPEKLIKLIIREMEDTLVELKASCAGVMANCKQVQRQLLQAEALTKQWHERASLAVKKERDGLAREALLEKRHALDRCAALRKEYDEHEALVAQYQEDIQQLQDKLDAARNKQRMLVQRQARASAKLKSQEEIRRIESNDAIMRFEELENRIERMEVEADFAALPRKSKLENEFESLRMDDELEQELLALKSSLEKSEIKPGEV